MNPSASPAGRLLAVQPEIQQALDAGHPVMALESTLICHGLPWPRNLDTARQLEAIVREQGVMPATIAILDGRLRVGLGSEQLERLARLGDKAIKCSRRDIAVVLQQHRAGATTVAATMIIAAMAGIRIFATGGIGGVHRGAAQTLDISADLPELARTPMAVVCSGPKAILDLPLTAQYLETHGVPVIGYQTDELPSFYSRTSGLPVDHRLDTPAEVAEFLHLKWSLGLGGGVLLANPVPEEHAIEPEIVEKTVDLALREAERQGVSGRVLTPFLLARMERLTGGDSLKTNIALVLSNARVGARMATAYHSASD
ncbi:pseudouridine-5'-phosphate glycosidase [Elongatibacter sediminis]|uniref:Pseudouridine-5'-phosphate glycosidase n=1 Tax=Elongatibacter sediminis TaxID=3119006 RepID=A0AAW9RA66_9GAMM